jgi:chromate transporter
MNTATLTIKQNVETVPTMQPSFGEAVRFWLKLGCISFGGPAGQVAIMHTELVERKRWIDEEHFLHGLNFCMLLPGPEAQQLATYIGWLFHGTKGGIVAGVLFVLPSAVILWLLSWLYVVYGTLPIIASLFYGLKPAVMALVAFAVLRIGGKALKSKVPWAIAAASFCSVAVFNLPFPLIVLGAACAGLVVQRLGGTSPLRLPSPQIIQTGLQEQRKQWFKRSLTVIALCGSLWIAPILASMFVRGETDILTQQGVFFSKAAMVTFGGAYAVLPYVATEAVEQFHWLSAAQMMDGLGLAETTPGPLIMIVQFVGFVGAWNHALHAGSTQPLALATLGAAMTTWVTFAPCFLWIFLGAPYIERLRSSRLISSALQAITAAVVGVVLNLALWFSVHTIAPTIAANSFASVLSSGIARIADIDFFALSAAIVLFVGLWRFKWNIILVVLCGAALGATYKLFFA